MSFNPDNMQSGDVSEDNVIVKDLGKDVVDGKTRPEFLGTVVPDSGGGGEEKGVVEQEEEAEDMEVEFVGNSDFKRGAGVLENLVEGREGLSLEGEKGSDNVVSNEVEESGSRAVLEECEGVKSSGASDSGVEGVGVRGGSERASFNLSAQQLFSKAVNNEGVSKEVKAAAVDGLLCDVKTIDGDVAAVGATATEVEKQVTRLSDSRAECESKVIRSETDAGKDNIASSGAHGLEGGFSGTKSVTLAGESDSSGKSIGKKSKGKGGFCSSDLVWGKVRNHPWWPAQIFDPEDASNQAKKHSRSKGFLVAYFWDKTFAWNDETTLKPFAPHFSQMVKQSTTEAFQHAVNCALDEVARRVEFGLSCNCIVDDVYKRLKTQVVENAGIREKSRLREGCDRFYSVSTFEPMKFLKYVKDLAQSPHVEGVDRLEYVMTRAQMAALYRWKGGYHLAEFCPLIGYVNNEADAPVSREKDETNTMLADATAAPQRNEHENRPQKRKNSSGDIGNATKKVRHASDSIKKGKRKRDYDDESEVEAASMSRSPSVGRRKEAKFSHSASTTKVSRPQSTPSTDPKPSFSIGESILRIADQLSQPSPLLKRDSSTETKKVKGKGKQSNKQAELTPSEESSPDVIFSQLILAAVEPVKEHSLLSSMITFVSDFRNSVVQGSELMTVLLEESAGEDIDGKSEKSPWSGSEEMAKGSAPGTKFMEKTSGSNITPTSGVKAAENACCNDKVTYVLTGPTCLTAEKMAPIELERSKVDGSSIALPAVEGPISAYQQHINSKGGQSTEEMQQEESPTAFTLKFTDKDSIPSEAKLNEIFSAFGPLRETETEVVSKKNCARVVFKRHVDAQAAFSSSGKYDIFGASLVCYRLDPAPSPRKPSPGKAKQRRKDGTAVESIAA